MAYGFPLSPYTGIPDVVEVWFSNSSLVTDYSYREEFKNRFGTSIYNRYRWTINYFYTVKNKQNESAAEQWLSDQFNPFVVENMPPIIPLFKLRWDVEFSLSREPVKIFAVVHLILKDVGGIYNITIRSLDTAKVFWVNTSGHNMIYDVAHRFIENVENSFINPYEFAEAIRKATNDGIKVEIQRGWG